jgi:hypothetical protein
MYYFQGLRRVAQAGIIFAFVSQPRQEAHVIQRPWAHVGGTTYELRHLWVGVLIQYAPEERQ